MILFWTKTAIAALIISFVSKISQNQNVLAGFLTALPLTSMLALAFSHMESKDPQNSFEYAKSIFFAVPLSLLFFVPFLFIQKFNGNFWLSYTIGCLLIFVGYLIHSKFFA